MFDLNIFENQCKQFLDECEIEPNLFHIHFTLKTDPKESTIKIPNPNGIDDIYQVHKLYLPGSGLQFLTNIKTTSFATVVNCAQRLIDSKYDFIGYKLEALFKTSDITGDKISNNFKYIEIHVPTRAKEKPTKENCLLSWSFKKSKIAYATRFDNVASFKDFVNNNNYNEYLTEVACFDYWIVDLESNWKKMTFETFSFENMLKDLKTYMSDAVV